MKRILVKGSFRTRKRELLRIYPYDPGIRAASVSMQAASRSAPCRATQTPLKQCETGIKIPAVNLDNVECKGAWALIRATPPLNHVYDHSFFMPELPNDLS
jgi:hypothetical protein